MTEAETTFNLDDCRVVLLLNDEEVRSFSLRDLRTGKLPVSDFLIAIGDEAANWMSVPSIRIIGPDGEQLGRVRTAAEIVRYAWYGVRPKILSHVGEDKDE